MLLYDRKHIGVHVGMGGMGGVPSYITEHSNVHTEFSYCTGQSTLGKHVPVLRTGHVYRCRITTIKSCIYGISDYNNHEK